ncbi:MAG: hypothetical protein HQM10_10995 [Candidatus Riflebacteria bacterium]|nr:hypothetical protein [Candidatus Riflebacteria bacterium]
MSKYISELFNPDYRFFRSVNLEQDFFDPQVLMNYVMTDYTLNCFERISAGFNNNSTQRAWRITGDYGTGKSSFALFLTKLLSGKSKELSSDVQNQIYTNKSLSLDNLKFQPLLLTGHRGSFSKSLARVLVQNLKQLQISNHDSDQNTTDLIVKLKRISDATKNLFDGELLNLFNDYRKLIKEKTNFSGVLLVIDEMGKFLEYSALYPEQQDVFLFQQIAEMAARSADSPLIIVSLLHQGFNTYSSKLPLTTQREWQKIAGRFEELLFNQPLEQIASLISRALNSNISTQENKAKIKTTHSTFFKKTIQLGWYGNSAYSLSLEKTSLGHFPLHPTVIPVLIRFFHYFAQNERSLFSFLLGNEPFGLQFFSKTKILSDSNFFKLPNLYDYIKTNFGNQLSLQNGHLHWAQLDSIIEGFHHEDDLEKDILKITGLLNILHADDLSCTRDLLSVALGNNDNSEKINISIEKLIKEGIIYSRGKKEGFCLWPHLSIDLNKVYEKAVQTIGNIERVADLIKEKIDPTPLVARRHYIKTGNLRYFTIRHCTLDDISSQTFLDFELDLAGKNLDGLLIIPLCENLEEVNKAQKIAEKKSFKEKKQVIFAIPGPLNSLVHFLQDHLCWEWISLNTPELHADRFAAEEVARKRNLSKLTFEKNLKNYINLKIFSSDPGMEIFQCGSKVKVSSGREFLELLSKTCDEVFSKAPILKNELINRRNISASAAAARMRLVERIFKSSEKAFLGMDPEKKPPEMSIYLSVLKHGNLHSNEGGLSLPEPKKDECNFYPVFSYMIKELENTRNSRISVSEMVQKIKLPPYGVREGLAFLFLAVFAAVKENEIAFYEGGSFVPKIESEEFLRLIKKPETFEMQYCKIDGVKKEIFTKLIKTLELATKNSTEPEFLDIVKPLCTFVSQLPPYAIKTKKLSKRTLGCRDTIMSARDPIKLIFEELPQILEVKFIFDKDNGPSITNKSCFVDESASPNYQSKNLVQEFVSSLKNALDELKYSYPELLNRIKREILIVFDSTETFANARIAIASRAEAVLCDVREPRLKAFCLRLFDDNLPEMEWIESIGSLIANKPPKQWNDNDEEHFYREADEIIQRFKRVENTVFGRLQNPSALEAVRVGITHLDGTERHEVLYCTKSDILEAQKLQKKIENLIAENKSLGLFAASQAILKNLNMEKEVESDA